MSERIFIVFAIHGLTMLCISVNPPHRPRHHHRASIAPSLSQEGSLAVDSVRGEEEIAAEHAERVDAVFLAEFVANAALIVVRLLSNHAERDVLPESERSRAAARENAASRKREGVHSVGNGDIDGGVLEESEQIAIGVRIAGKHVRIDDERVAEGEVPVVEHSRVPLLSLAHQIFAVDGHDHREKGRGLRGHVAVRDQRDVGGGVHFENALRVEEHLRHVLVARTAQRIRVKHHAFFEKRRRNTRKMA